MKRVEIDASFTVSFNSEVIVLFPCYACLLNVSGVHCVYMSCSKHCKRGANKVGTPSLSPSPILPQLNVIDTKECVPSFGAPGDGVDNDCDLNVDEELYNSIDDDQDGVVDEV